MSATFPNRSFYAGYEWLVGGVLHTCWVDAFQALSQNITSDFLHRIGGGPWMRTEVRFDDLPDDLDACADVRRAWLRGKSLAEIERAFGWRVHVPGGLADLHRNIVAGNFHCLPNAEE